MSILKFIWDSLVSIVNTIRLPADIIDIVVVAFVVYKAIQIVRDTRAAQLIKGIAVLVVSFLLAKLLNLRTMDFILRNVFQIIGIALVVVFQPELRRILEKVGRSKFNRELLSLTGAASDDELIYRRSISAVCDTVDYFSQKKIGCIIVFERETSLGEIIATGTVIDAEASSNLLENIFFPNSLLHDGAVIIREGRIYAAGCFLPLTENSQISKELGTRHRAALGLSEDSDAVIVVVSEETGTISVAIDGFLNRGLSINSLRSTLENNLIVANALIIKNTLGRKKKEKRGEKKNEEVQESGKEN